MSWSASTFPMKPLGELARIQAGYAFESARFTDSLTDVPLVKGENVQQGYVDWSIAKRWPEAEMDALEQFLLKPGDIVVAMDRPWVEAGLKWAYIKQEDPPSLLVQRVARLRAGPELDQTYLRAVISSSYFSAYIQPIVTGVNVPHISGKQIASFKVPVPAMALQKKIAALVSTYDDLIANNQRRITLLESMAEEIYREWFVRMRFPGCERAEFYAGRPVTWQPRRLGQILQLRYGKSLPEGQRVPGPYPVYGSAGVVGTHSEALVAKPSIVVGRKGNVGSIFWVRKPFYPIDTVYYVESELPLVYLRFLLASMNFINSDAAVPGLNREQAYANEVLLPQDSFLSRFEEIVGPIYQQVGVLEDQVTCLRNARDALLPRLISGKLRVDSLDIQFPPSMQPPPAKAAQRAARSR